MSKRDTDSNGTLVVTYREDEGEVDKRRLAGILGAATTVMMLLLVITLSLGMVGAAMGVGIGGFVANFGTVDADGGVIYPVVGEQAACDNAPQLEASLSGTATVDRYVEFYKDLPIPQELSLSNQDHVRITILSNLSSSNVTAQNLDLRLTALEAEDLVLGDNDTTTPKATIQEFGPGQYNTSNSTSNYAPNASYAPTGAGQAALNGSPAGQTPEFGINASTGFRLKNGTAAAHQVAFQQISLPQVDVAVNFINSSYGPSDSGPASRVINPGERTCSALANASQWDSFNSPGVANTTSGNVGYPSDG